MSYVRFYWSSLLSSMRKWVFCGRGGGYSSSTLQRVVAKFQTANRVNNLPTPVCQKTTTSAANIVGVHESVQESLKQLIPRRAQELGLCQTSTWRVLRQEVGLHSYEIQLIQELKVNDHKQRRFFAKWASRSLHEIANFGWKTILSNEVDFRRNRYVNKFWRYSIRLPIQFCLLFDADFWAYWSILFQKRHWWASMLSTTTQ